MLVRELRWYRKEEEIFSKSDQEDQDLLSKSHVISYYLPVWLRHVTLFTNVNVWFCYSFLDTCRVIPTREEFEKYYLEWKAENEG